MTTQPATATGGGYFPTDALETNRSGRLTDTQRRNLSGSERSYRKNELVGAIMAAIVGVLVLSGNGPNSHTIWQPLFGIGFLAVAAFFLVRSLTGDAVAQDLRSPRVVQVEGAIEKSIVNVDGSQHGPSEFYYARVAGQKFEISGLAYHALPEAGYVRLFVLSRSHKLVNFERLPDPPVPDSVLHSPQAVMTDLAKASRSHDSIERAEAKAEIQAIGNAMRPNVSHEPATPPAADARDARPLAEAIVGTWRSGFITVTFRPDGSVDAQLGARDQRGHWSVDGQGRLQSDAMGGGEQVAEAWVAGDTLTISVGGEALRLQRTA